MKIIFLTNKCSHGAEILKEIKKNKIDISAIIIEKPPPLSAEEKLQRIAKKGFWKLFIAISQKIKHILHPKHHEEYWNDEFYNNFSKKVLTVENHNSSQCESEIKQMAPDIIVLGGARIIKKNIISIPKLGILNAHPGLLPKYRGIDVIPWAIINGDDVGVTVHLIDEGVDTGKILTQKKLPLMPGDNIKILRYKAGVLAGELMTKTLQTIFQKGIFATVKNPKNEGKQFYKINSKTLKVAEQLLQEMLTDDK